MKIVKDVKEITPLAGGSMGDGGGGRKKPPATPNDRDNSEGGEYQRRMWNERSLNPRQVHFRAGHAESTPGNNPKQGELW